MMKLTINDFSEALATQEKPIRQHAEFCLSVISQVCGRALSFQATLRSDYFVKKSNAVYAHATTDSQLEALRISLCMLYELHIVRNHELQAPTLYFPIKKQMPIICESMPTLFLQHALNEVLDTQLKNANTLSPQQRWAMHLLLLARHASINNTRVLNSIANNTLEDVIIFTHSKRWTFKVSKTAGVRLWLDGIALLHFRRLVALHNQSKRKSTVEDAITSWVGTTHARFAHMMPQNLSVPMLLDALTFSSRVMAKEHFAKHCSPLDDNQLIRAVAGIQISSKKETDTPLANRQRRQFSELEKLATVVSPNNISRLSYNSTHGGDDLNALYSFRDFLTTFKEKQTDEKRNTVHFKSVKAQTLSLLSQAHEQTSELSAIAILILTYCTDLFLHGSTFKSRLAVNTILTYVSTLSTFASNAWNDESLLSAAQSNIDSLSEQSEVVANALSDLNSADKQSTVINFIQYLTQANELKLFDSDELDYFGAAKSLSRVHYISPGDFDIACSKFISEVNSYERRQCVQFLRLCYSFGLRDQEATLLDANDVDFDTGSLYVTRLHKRKTMKSVRRVPLCFLTPTHLYELTEYIQERQALQNGQLFDAEILSVMLPQFLAHLRIQCDQSDLVVHSLRHCAANNMLYQLSLCCFPQLKAAREQYAFLNHPVYQDEQLQLIAASLASQGRTTNEYFFVLDTLSVLLGHVSPAVTASSYLHVFDLLCFELVVQSAPEIDVEAFAGLLPNNSYRFDLQKQFTTATNTSPATVEAFIFKIATHGARGGNKYALCKTPLAEATNDTLTLSDFIRQLDNYKTYPHHSGLNQDLLSYFEVHASTLPIEFLADIKPREQSCWLQLLERLTRVTWNAMNRHAIEKLNECLTVGYIFDKRTLHQYLRALGLLGLNKLSFKILTPTATKTPTNWIKDITDAGHNVKETPSDDISQPQIKVRPYQLRWPAWDHLPGLLPILKNYLNFLTSAESSHG